MAAFDPWDIIFDPDGTVHAGTEGLKARRAGTFGAGVPLGLTSLDKVFLPALPGELISIIGRPGSGKTGFMMRWARWRAHWLADHGPSNRVVVYVSWEQSVEELYAFNVAADSRLSITAMNRGEISDAEWDQVISAGLKYLTFPLWFVGFSMEKRKKRPHLDMTNLGLAMKAIEDQDNGKHVLDMVFLDYLQRIPAEGRPESKNVGTSDILDRCKDMALALGCPVVLGVQARREVDDRKIPIPQMDDGQWTSNIEQTSDKILSLCRPAMYRDAGKTFLGQVVEGHCQLYISILKQKSGDAHKGSWAYFDPVYNKLDELELKFAPQEAKPQAVRRKARKVYGQDGPDEEPATLAF